MALIGNYNLLNRTPVRQFNTGLFSGNTALHNPSSSQKNRFIGGFVQKNGNPNGYLHPASWVLPLTPGSLSTYNQSSMVITNVNALAYMGLALAGSSALTITVQNSTLDQIVALVASGVLQLTLTSSNLSAGVLAVADSSMAISVTLAQLGGIIPVTASANMVLTPSVVMTAKAFMEASAGGPTALSPEGLAAAVLAIEIETGFNLQEALRLILSATAGKLSGAATTTIEIRNVTDAKARITATVDADGNRTAVTLDAT